MDRVVCAANRYKQTGLLILGPRHFDTVMRETMRRIGLEDFLHDAWEQGFINQLGTFLTRKEAFKVADEAGQILHMVGSQKEFYSLPTLAEYHDQELFSENLY